MKKFHTEIENFYVSFSDLLSLLLIFFVYLFSMSTIDPVKYTQTTESLSEEFGKTKVVSNTGKQINQGPTKADATGKAIGENVANGPTKGAGDAKSGPDSRSAQGILATRLGYIIDKENLAGKAVVKVDAKSVRVVLESPVLFDSGSAELSQEGKSILKKLAPVLKDVTNPIVVDGHTDNVPINTPQFGSNWELSFSRALSVMKCFVSLGFSPNQLSGTGFGEYRPLVPNNSDTNRAKNRRIEISVLRNYDAPDEVSRSPSAPDNR